MSPTNAHVSVIPERYAAKRPWRHFVALVVILVMVAGSFWAAEWDFRAFTEADRREAAFERMGNWLAAFASPETSREWLETCYRLTLQTLSAAVLGTALAVVFGYLLALGSSRAVMVGEEKRRGFLRNFPLRNPRAAICSLCRLIQDVLRAVPDFVWAVIIVAAIGLGPLTGALALALNITGILAKVYSELWDAVPEREYEQVRSLGAGRMATFLYGIRPLAARSVQSFTLMRAECAIRNAAVIGAVGGGGLGSEVRQQISFGNWENVSTLILFTLALTLTADLASNFIRRQLRNDPNHPRAAKSRSVAWNLSRSYVGVGFALLVVAWSFWFMGWGNNTPPEQPSRNYLQPAAQLMEESYEQVRYNVERLLGADDPVKPDSNTLWQRLSFFEELLQPRLDGEAIGLGDPEEVEQHRADGDTVNLFAEYGPLEFWRPAAWSAWNDELSKWFVWRVVQSSFVVLAMAIIGTLLGILAAIALTYPHSIAFQLESRQFTGERVPLWVRLQRFVAFVVARLTGLFARGVPEVVWAILLIAFFGPTLIAGTIALAIHTMGVLVRVFSETVDNIPYRRFEQCFMGSRMTCFGYAAAPTSWNTWMTYAFFQFESNVRMAIVLGMIGVGGLGFYFDLHFGWFNYDVASTYLIMMILLTVIIDRISRALNISRVSR